MIKIIKKIYEFFCGAQPQKPKQEEKHAVYARDPEEFERCVMCGAVTCIPISMPVDWRENYEMGFGQICAECATKTWESACKEKELTTSQVILAVEQSRKENNQ